MITVSRQPGSTGRVIALLGLFCFVLTTAILPAGHMASSLASGSAFTFCPSDSGSAVWIDLLGENQADTNLSSLHGAHHHGDHGAGQPDIADHGTHNTASPECELASAAAAGAFVVSTDPVGFPPGTDLTAPPLGEPLFKRRHWLRPPVRSPTA